MEIKLYEHRKHFREVYRWWKTHRKSPLDIESLSSLGVVVCEADQMLACTWIYVGKDCTVAQLGWSVSNPDVSMRKAHDAVEVSIREAIAVAKDSGCNRLTTMSSSRGLTRVFERSGFRKLIQHDFLVKAL